MRSSVGVDAYLWLVDTYEAEDLFGDPRWVAESGAHPRADAWPLPYCGIVEPIRETAQFEAAADTATVKAAVRLVLVEKHHGRLDKGDDEFPAIHFGSATSLRLWGLGGPRTYGRLPIIVRISVASRDGHSSVNVDLSSEEGFYLARLPGTEEHYRRRFSDLFDDLRSELPAQG